MEKLKCTNPECKNIVDALHMDDDGYCNDCHDGIIDELVIEESDETRFLCDESLRIMCEHPVRVRTRPSRPSTNFHKKPCY
jgi:hypothetical protein